MRRLAVLLAATLMVSVPLTMTVTTDVYAASKKVKKAKRAKAPKAAPAEAGVQPPFAQITRAIGDLGNSLYNSSRR
jgi:hypothetical protein